MLFSIPILCLKDLTRVKPKNIYLVQSTVKMINRGFCQTKTDNTFSLYLLNIKGEIPIFLLCVYIACVVSFLYRYGVVMCSCASSYSTRHILLLATLYIEEKGIKLAAISAVVCICVVKNLISQSVLTRNNKTKRIKHQSHNQIPNVANFYITKSCADIILVGTCKKREKKSFFCMSKIKLEFM